MSIKIFKSTGVPRGKLFEVISPTLIDTLEVEYMRIKYYPDADALDIRISDEKPDYGEEAGEEMILHYTKRGKLVKIEILDASKTVIDFLEPILSQKPLAKAVSY